MDTHGHALSALCFVETEAQRSQAAGPRSHSELSEELGLHKLQLCNRAQPARPSLPASLPPSSIPNCVCPSPGMRCSLIPRTSLSAEKLLPLQHRRLCGGPAHGPQERSSTCFLAGRSVHG